MKNVIPKAIPRGVLLQQENRPFPRTLSSRSDSNTSYNRKGVAGRAVRRSASERKRGTATSNVPKTNCRHDRIHLDIYA